MSAGAIQTSTFSHENFKSYSARFGAAASSDAAAVVFLGAGWRFIEDDFAEEVPEHLRVCVDHRLALIGADKRPLFDGLRAQAMVGLIG